jgi:hypothetical protein
MRGMYVEREKDTLLLQINKIRAGVKVCMWIMESLNEGLNEPESEKSELNAGTAYFLELLSEELDRMNGKIDGIDKK